MSKIGRNDPCPCGSGKKYKKCCIDKERMTLQAVNKDIPIDMMKNFPHNDFVTPQMIIEACPKIASEMAIYNKKETIKIISKLLLIPKLQGNIYRIECLVILAISTCQGEKIPSIETIEKWFNSMARTFCGQMEDSPEDLFSGSIQTKIGSYRILGGLTSGCIFYVQKVIEIIEGMPSSPFYDELRNKIYDVLKISDALAERANLESYSFGDECTYRSMPEDCLEKLNNNQFTISFLLDNLLSLGVDAESINEFSIDVSEINGKAEFLLNTHFDKKPFLKNGDEFLLALPTLLGHSIRGFLIDSCVATGQEESLSRNFWNLCLKEVSSLGTSTDTINENIIYYLDESDPAVVFVKIFVFIEICDYTKAVQGKLQHTSKYIKNALMVIQEKLRENESRDVMVIIVHCGFGLGHSIPVDPHMPKTWKWDSLSMYDYLVLEKIEGFEFLDLLRIKKQQQILRQSEVNISNLSGIMNDVALCRTQGGHILPQNIQEIHQNRPTMFFSDQSSHISLKKEYWLNNHTLSLPSLSGDFVEVRKRTAFLQKPETVHLYITEHFPPRAVYFDKKHVWWLSVDLPNLDTNSGRLAGMIWEMIELWLPRIASTLDKRFNLESALVLEWHLIFKTIPTNSTQISRTDFEFNEVFQIEANGSKINISALPSFFEGQQLESNLMEKMFVHAMLLGASEVLGTINSELEDLLNLIVPNSDMKQIHVLPARSFRDNFRESENHSFVKINRIDHANLSYGLAPGWQLNNGPQELDEKQSCLDYLNTLVYNLEERLCEYLRCFSRADFIQKVTINLEHSKFDKQRWETSARALAATYGDEFAQALYLREGEFSIVSITARILIEAAICECPDNGAALGDYDLSQLMALAEAIFQYGGISDAIRWDAVKPNLYITSFGDVHFYHDFLNHIVTPFSRTFSDYSGQKYSRRYSDLFLEQKSNDTDFQSLDKGFLDAFEIEHGFSLHNAFMFCKSLQQHSINNRKLTYTLRQSEISHLAQSENLFSDEVINNLISSFTLFQRGRWREIPDGFEEKDRFPWKFRRKLSLMRRPLIQLTDSDDPIIFVSPGMFEDCLHYIRHNFFTGEFPPEQCHSKEMRSWIGKANGVNRLQFNTMVSDRLREYGWHTELEVKLPHIFKESLEKNYGDVDVLAWNDSGRVLIIECKDLQAHRTLGEIAEQLSNYRGELNHNGKPDNLRKHLNRFEILKENKGKLMTFLNTGNIELESHLVFRNPTPVLHTQELLKDIVKLSLYEELSSI